MASVVTCDVLSANFSAGLTDTSPILLMWSCLAPMIHGDGNGTIPVLLADEDFAISAAQVILSN